MSSFISCTMHLVLLGWRCQGGLWQARGKCDIQTTFWSQNLSFTEKAEQKHKKKKFSVDISEHNSAAIAENNVLGNVRHSLYGVDLQSHAT